MPFYKIDPNTSRIKMFFEDIPSYQTRNILKANHWRWDPSEKCWYNHSNSATVEFADKLCPSPLQRSNYQLHETNGIFKKGICGKASFWMLSPFGQLVIAGSGKIDGHSYDQMDKSPWFAVRDQIKHIAILEGISGIGNRAFYELPNLEIVELPSSLWSIGDRAFSKCAKLKSINLPEKLGAIGVQAFRDCCNIREIHIPLYVTEIGEDCFKNWTESQRIYRMVKDQETEKVVEVLQRVAVSETDAISQIYFEDFVTVTTNNYCVGKGHRFENIRAMVHILLRDGNLKTVTIPAGYCQTCKKYFIGYWQFENLRKLGIVLCRMVHEKYQQTGSSADFYDSLSPESILKQSGYSVGAKDDLTDEQRRQILICLMESGICSKQKITSHLSWLIQSREGRMDLVNAVYKWTTDRGFVDSYKMGSGRVVAMKALRVRR